MIQQAKELEAKLEDPSSITGTHMTPTSCCTNMLWHAYPPTNK